LAIDHVDGRTARGFGLGSLYFRHGDGTSCWEQCGGGAAIDFRSSPRARGVCTPDPGLDAREELTAMVSERMLRHAPRLSLKRGEVNRCGHDISLAAAGARAYMAVIPTL